MSEVPAHLKYTKDHEWLRLEDDGTCTVGITDYAQDSLGDITFVELPAEGDRLDSGATFGVVESVKAASDLYAPVGGEVVSANTALEDAPETVNGDPYGEGWMIKIKPTDPADLDDLMTPEDYQKLV